VNTLNQTNSLLQLLCTYPSTINHTLTNLRQFYYVLVMINGLNDCFMQLRTPRRWASEGRHMDELTYYIILVILINYAQLLIYTVTTKS